MKSDTTWIIILTLVATAIIMTMAIIASEYEDDDCQSCGGHLIHIDRGVLCITIDGRVIDLAVKSSRPQSVGASRNSIGVETPFSRPGAKQ